MAKNRVRIHDERVVKPCRLYLDLETGIAWVENGSTGLGHSCHPNISAAGSVAGMKRQGFWARDCRTVRSHGLIYNVSVTVATDSLDAIAAELCRCPECNTRKAGASC